MQINRNFSASLSKAHTRKYAYEQKIKKKITDYECERQSETCSQFICLCKLSKKKKTNKSTAKTRKSSKLTSQLCITSQYKLCIMCNVLELWIFLDALYILYSIYAYLRLAWMTVYRDWRVLKMQFRLYEARAC